MSKRIQKFNDQNEEDDFEIDEKYANSDDNSEIDEILQEELTEKTNKKTTKTTPLTTTKNKKIKKSQIVVPMTNSIEIFDSYLKLLKLNKKSSLEIDEILPWKNDLFVKSDLNLSLYQQLSNYISNTKTPTIIIACMSALRCQEIIKYFF